MGLLSFFKIVKDMKHFPCMVAPPVVKEPYHFPLPSQANLVYTERMNASAPLFMASRPSGTVAFVRELTEEDVLLLDVNVQGVGTPALKRLNDRHHKVAQLLASGMKPTEVSLATGMCVSRISILQNDPAFKDLLAFYREHSRSAAVDQLSRLGLLTAVATEELAFRLEEKPEEFTNKDLVSVVKLAADRSGFGPTSKHQVLHAHVTAADVTELRKGLTNGTVRVLAPADRRAGRSLADGQSVPQLNAPEEIAGAEEGKHLREEGASAPEAVAPGSEVRAVDQV